MHAYMYGKEEGKGEGGEGGGGRGREGGGGNEEGGVRVCLLLLFVYDYLHLLVCIFTFSKLHQYSLTCNFNSVQKYRRNQPSKDSPELVQIPLVIRIYNSLKFAIILS